MGGQDPLPPFLDQHMRFCTVACADPESPVRVVRGWGAGVVLTTVFSHQRVSQRVVRTSLEKQWSIYFSRGSVPDFLRKRILATCNLPVGGRSHLSGFIHV